MTRSALLQPRISGALLDLRRVTPAKRLTGPSGADSRRRYKDLSTARFLFPHSAAFPTAPHGAARRQRRSARQRQEWRSRTSGSPARPDPTPAAPSAPRGARAAARRAALGVARPPAPPRPSPTFPPEEGHGAGEGAKRPLGGREEGAGGRGQRAGLPMNEAPSPARRHLSLRLFLPRRRQRPPCCQQPPRSLFRSAVRGACRDAAAPPALGRPANPRRGAAILEEGTERGGHLGRGQGAGRRSTAPSWERAERGPAGRGMQPGDSERRDRRGAASECPLWPQGTGRRSPRPS